MSHAPAHHHAIHTEEEQGPRKSWALLGIALAAQILVVLDISVVNTALPTIGRSLRLDGSRPAVARHGVRDDVRRAASCSEDASPTCCHDEASS